MGLVTERDPYIPPAYYDGVAARAAELPKDAPPWLSPQGKSWWLAGFNDKDIELGLLRREPLTY